MKPTAKPRKRGNGTGVGVDAFGGAVVDPTANVIALNDAATKRVDDLRLETDRRVNAELKHLKRVEKLRASYAKEIRELESRRLDAIRQVDVAATKTEADRALAAIQTLAATTATNAENIRNQMTNTAATIAKQTSDTVSQITERIAALEKSSYEGAGKQAYADPMLAELVAQVKALTTSGAGQAGRGQGVLAGREWLAWIVALLIGLLFFYNQFKPH